MVPPPAWHVLLGEHVCPLGQVPQLSVLPHPSAMVPQPLAGHVFGVQVCGTHTLFTQVAFTAQVPQLSVPPQPSAMLPQFLPWAAQVVGVHPGAWHVPPVHV
jgi:hypothetical protein